MAERPITTSAEPWPTWRDALSYRLGYLQATVDIHKMQQSPPTSGNGTRNFLKRAKDWAEGFELASKLWGMRHRLAWSILIAGWWDYLVSLVRFIVG